MMLKLKTLDAHGFLYVDRIETFEIVPIMDNCMRHKVSRPSDPKLDLKLFPHFERTILFYHEMDETDGKVVSLEEGSGSEAFGTLYSLTVKRTDGTEAHYLTDMKIYLMSDTGKTVERFN